jgi:leucyl aminopeptidase
MPATDPATVLIPAAPGQKPVPIWLARDASWVGSAPLSEAQKAWVAAQAFKGTGRKHLALPGPAGELAGVVLGLGEARAGDPMDQAELALGLLPGVLPPGLYQLAGAVENAELACVAWGLGAYRFGRYKSAGNGEAVAQLALPQGADHQRALAAVEAVWMGRDLINTPASDLGPQELEDAARALAVRHGAEVASIVGEDLLAQNFPMIHAVGRASDRAPRLIDLRWDKATAGRAAAPRVTLVGKGICFDTGGLDVKPASGMLIMKKDMGGAATALALAHMVMAARLDVRLRVLIPAADNSISGNAFRPGDVLRSRAGKTVEIGNTDAEGRLVLADALTLADEECPDTLVSLATLTGAARVALGPDLPPLYTDDDAFAASIAGAGSRIGDPVWRMPFWAGYETMLDSPVADMNNVSDSGFAGSVTAALFLRRFVKQARRFAHLDIYGWRQAAKALGPKGGEVQGARALFEVLRARAAS